jgi:threonine aldolase
MRRRNFLAAPALAGFLPAAQGGTADQRVIATGDGLSLSPEEYSAILQKQSPGLKPDSYSQGGVVARLEEKVAAALGKETAVWLPTGTLANHLAVRLLAGDKRRVLVQQECHLFNDCGDCCETLSGLHLVPLAPGQATFTLQQVEAETERAATGRVAVPIGAIQIETPVRRKSGEAFDMGEMKRISTWARERKVGLHLDGARLFMASAYSGVGIREYASLFDTVYVSMYKYFNAASGAVLAGPRSLLENLFHTRRMFGGGLSHVWPFAAVADSCFDGFPERFAQAVKVSEKVIAGLKPDNRFEVTRIPNGTNIFSLRVRQGDPRTFQDRLRKAGIVLGDPQGDRFLLSVNETWNRTGAQEVLDRLQHALT